MLEKSDLSKNQMGKYKPSKKLIFISVQECGIDLLLFSMKKIFKFGFKQAI